MSTSAPRTLEICSEEQTSLVLQEVSVSSKVWPRQLLFRHFFMIKYPLLWLKVRVEVVTNVVVAVFELTCLDGDVAPVFCVLVY